MNRLVTPKCCPLAKSSRAISLGYIYSRLDQVDFNEVEPEWVISGVDKYGLAITNKAHFCPFCGTKMPELERNPNPPKRIWTSDHDGDYCKTCGKRSRVCRCASPQHRWRIKQ